jgi:hypothetical protein
MSQPQRTDERLRQWLDGQQLPRERMCQAVLALDRRFSQVKPRHPRGGPDGARDLEAVFENKRVAWAAIGFQNSVSDSREERAKAKKKFKDDLKNALQENPNLKVFVFFTNVCLTAGEKQCLAIHGNQKGIEVTDIFDRERIRISLDSPEGLAFRFQYLGIRLSGAEQASFFARWGASLETLIVETIQGVDSRLARIEFFQEQSHPLTHFSFHLRLSRAVSKKEMPHFRACMSGFFLHPKPNNTQFHLAVCDNTPQRNPKDPSWDVFGTAWGKDTKKRLFESFSIRVDPLNTVVGTMNSGFMGSPLFECVLRDLSGARLAFFANRKLAELIEGIFVIANEYVVWSAERAELTFHKHDQLKTWPCKFTNRELSDPWVRIMSGGPAKLDFSRYTPQRLYKATELNPSLSYGR